MQVDGQMRKVLINAHKNGFLYVIDRTNGKLIAANPFVKVNWATHIDLKTGRPVLTDLLERAMKGEQVEYSVARHQRVADRVQSEDRPRVPEHVEPPAHDEVRGCQVRARHGSTGMRVEHGTPKGEPAGYHMAIDPLTGKVEWQVPIWISRLAGMLATDGGLLFTGLLTGEVVALDQDTGKTLWQFKTGSSVNAPPITYTYKGTAIRDRVSRAAAAASPAVSSPTACRPADRCGLSR